MILVFELNWTGRIHAPGNSATVQTVALAFPNHSVRVFADAAHILELKRDASLTILPNIGFCVVPTFDLLRGKPEIVSFRRMFRELRIFSRALRAVPPTDPTLVLMLSTTSTSIIVAAWLAKWFRSRKLAIQIGLHGNLNDIKGWRSRNPFRRAFDLMSAFNSRLPDGIRFLVLDGAVHDELVTIMPGIAPRVDTLPLPVSADELAQGTVVALNEPIRIGFVGLATQAKGADVFLEIARQAKERFGSRIEFDIVGRQQSGFELKHLDNLCFPVSTEVIPREEFTRRLSKLHYVLLPFRTGYYNLSASGALNDALTWAKPIIATRIPLTERLFSEYGDVGYLCHSQKDILGAIEIIMTIDGARYREQISAMTAAGEARLPTKSAVVYRKLLLNFGATFARWFDDVMLRDGKASGDRT